jgi:hypothetical protein
VYMVCIEIIGAKMSIRPLSPIKGPFSTIIGYSPSLADLARISQS